MTAPPTVFVGLGWTGVLLWHRSALFASS